MRVLLTGATGFTGSRVLRILRASGHEVRCVVRRSTERLRAGPQMEVVVGDIGEPDSLMDALTGVEAVVNTASLGFGHAPQLIQAIRDAGIRRAVFVSTTAIFTQLNATSKAVRVAAEGEIERSGLDYTILRPTMIYGARGDRNMARLITFIRRSPVMPIFGDGRNLQQPVHVEDVARACVAVLDRSSTACRAYNISGGTALTFNEVINTIAAALQKRVLKVHLPWRPAVAMLLAAERARLRLPVRAEQLLRLNEDKAFDYSAASRDFGYTPRSFAEGIAAEVAELIGR